MLSWCAIAQRTSTLSILFEISDKSNMRRDHEFCPTRSNGLLYLCLQLTSYRHVDKCCWAASCFKKRAEQGSHRKRLIAGLDFDYCDVFRSLTYEQNQSRHLTVSTCFLHRGRCLLNQYCCTLKLFLWRAR